MKKLNLILFFGIAFFFMSCEDSNKKTESKNNESAIEDPENLCDCIEIGYNKIKEIDEMTDDELSKNLNIYDDYKEGLEEKLDKKCKEFEKEARKKYKTKDKFKESCSILAKQEILKTRIKKRIRKLKENNQASNNTKKGNYGGYSNTSPIDEACDCVKWMNDEMDKILRMSVDELTNNPDIGDDFKRKLEGNTKCNDLLDAAKRKYDSPEEFMEVCPEMKEVMEKTNRMKNM
ncbi:MAG: hypothetical protein P8I93_08765 [Crocinitomicaceae bacterium]|nr:hypothetical protein [Crocinitomicaceae bacterium]